MPTIDITICGNLARVPDLRYTPVSREFAISEGCSAGNRSNGSR
jgi:hypothetical protein